MEEIWLAGVPSAPPRSRTRYMGDANQMGYPVAINQIARVGVTVNARTE